MIKDTTLESSTSDKRSREIRLNTILNFVFKALGILCTFAMVPLTLSYLNKNDYGVWLTLTSLTAWLSFMDIGLGNGLRNKLTEAISRNDQLLAKEYVSSTYVIFSLFMALILILFSLINSFLNWNHILKTAIDANELLLTAFLIVACFAFRLILDLSTTVIIALHKPYIKSLIDFIINLLSLLCVYILTKNCSPSIVLFSIAIAVIPIVVLSCFNYFLYYKSEFSFLKPTIKYFKNEHVKSLLNLGLQFFIIQIAGIVVFSTDNILITQIFSPSDVTAFNIAYKYFSICTFAFSIIVLPYWSAFTSAFVNKKNEWIKNSFKKLIFFWGLQVLGVVLLLIFAKMFFKMWVGDKVAVPISLSISLALYSIIYNWNNIFAYFINGVSKIRLQLYNAIFVGIVNIPLTFLCAHYIKLGVSSVVISNCICLLISSIWSPIQCYKIVYGKAKGIWNL